MADATSTRVNIFVSLAALTGLIGSQLSLPWLDIVDSHDWDLTTADAMA